ncbi:MAG: hypothetical protein AAGA60_16675 [Cyanobacteria bacterium P01_E01_bin.42]
MNEQSSPDLNVPPPAIAPDGSASDSSKSIQEQHIALKLEVEQIYRKVDRLRTGLQTLVSGLVVAILISIGVATWFSYRLLLEEKRAAQQTEQTLEVQKEMSDRLDVLKERVDSQERQIIQNRDQIPPDLNPFIEENRRQLQQLEERIERLGNSQPEGQPNAEE